ncbi:hypothetical protein IFR05_011737 [Cadophora sp. M221]|nr:hypothetical protein IFR05_011737 [Cadophora sp. M221]
MGFEPNSSFELIGVSNSVGNELNELVSDGIKTIGCGLPNNNLDLFDFLAI